MHTWRERQDRCPGWRGTGWEEMKAIPDPPILRSGYRLPSPQIIRECQEAAGTQAGHQEPKAMPATARDPLPCLLQVTSLPSPRPQPCAPSLCQLVGPSACNSIGRASPGGLGHRPVSELP